jgi:hypothetical protein
MRTRGIYSRRADQPKNWRQKFRLLSPSERDHLKYLQAVRPDLLSGTPSDSANTGTEPFLTSRNDPA